MKQMLLTIFCCLNMFLLFGQTTKLSLDSIKTEEQAKEFIEKKTQQKAKLFSISSDKDTTDITLPLFEKKNGYIFTLDNYHFKILNVEAYPEFRASYIYLDGSRLSMKEIDSIRNIIITKHKKGTPFYELANEFTMDGNTTGNLDWFKEGMMEITFELAIKAHKKNELFTVDIPERKWHYVVLKTFDDKIIKKLTILKVEATKIIN